jgi:hypothetical protein
MSVKGVEPPHLSIPDPKSSVSAISPHRQMELVGIEPTLTGAPTKIQLITRINNPKNILWTRWDLNPQQIG